MSTALVTKSEASKALATMLEQSRPRLAQIIPHGMSVDRVIGVTLNLFSRDPYIAECEPKSIVRAIVQATELGLDPSPKLGQVFFIPRNTKNKDGTWTKKLDMQIGYKGLLTKAYACDRILSVDAELVHERDTFKIVRGTHPDVVHEYDPGSERGKVTSGYFAARLGPKDAIPPVWKVSEMSLADLISIRDRSDSYRKWASAKANGKSWKDPPWVTDEGEMMKKTLLVRGLKMCPISDDFRKALDADAEEFRTARHVEDAPGPSRTDSLKEKLGVQASAPIEADFEDDPDPNEDGR